VITLQQTAMQTVTVGGITFKIRPETYVDYFQTSEFLREEGPADEKMLPKVAMTHGLIARVEGWEGVILPDGSAAPCSEENKLAFFNQNAQFIAKILVDLDEQEASASKNSETSPDGSPLEMEMLATPVEKASSDDELPPPAEPVSTEAPQ